MRFKLYREYGALNSRPIFDAFEKSLISHGHTSVDRDEEVAVIWSVLWSGRMASNKAVYDQCKNQNIPVVILEVGNLIRNVTWRISLDNINGTGIFNNQENLDPGRPKKIGVSLSSCNFQRKSEILIACQHQASLQWQGQGSMKNWVIDTVEKIRKYSSRNIVVRPHPRSPVAVNLPNVRLEIPKKINNTYDDFDIDYNYHCVINFNSGPAVQAAIKGIPIVCDSSSLAYPVSDRIENLENVRLPDREDWFLQLCHTEWTVEEISAGIPLSRLLPNILK